jgi:hypothetical protein
MGLGILSGWVRNGTVTLPNEANEASGARAAVVPLADDPIFSDFRCVDGIEIPVLAIDGRRGISGGPSEASGHREEVDERPGEAPRKNAWITFVQNMTI